MDCIVLARKKRAVGEILHFRTQIGKGKLRRARARMHDDREVFRGVRPEQGRDLSLKAMPVYRPGGGFSAYNHSYPGLFGGCWGSG